MQQYSLTGIRTRAYVFGSALLLTVLASFRMRAPLHKEVVLSIGSEPTLQKIQISRALQDANCLTYGCTNLLQRREIPRRCHHMTIEIPRMADNRTMHWCKVSFLAENPDITQRYKFVIYRDEDTMLNYDRAMKHSKKGHLSLPRNNQFTLYATNWFVYRDGKDSRMFLDRWNKQSFEEQEDQELFGGLQDQYVLNYVVERFGLLVFHTLGMTELAHCYHGISNRFECISSFDVRQFPLLAKSILVLPIFLDGALSRYKPSTPRFRTATTILSKYLQFGHVGVALLVNEYLQTTEVDTWLFQEVNCYDHSLVAKTSNWIAYSLTTGTMGFSKRKPMKRKGKLEVVSVTINGEQTCISVPSFLSNSQVFFLLRYAIILENLLLLTATFVLAEHMKRGK